MGRQVTYPMQDFYRELQMRMANGEAVAVATVIRIAGSVPREVGAKMIIHPEGRHWGTVGGGCGEAEVIRHALDVISTRRPMLARVDLTGDITLESDGICGGIMDMLIELWPPPEEEPALWSVQLAALAERGRSNAPMALLASLPPAPVRHVLLRGDGMSIGELPAGVAGRAAQMLAERRSGILSAEEAGGTAWFVEVQRATPTLLIVGAGHIAVPLAAMASMLDFGVVVLDDRPSFANTTRFPSADQVLCDQFEKALREFPIDADTYIVLITRGHQHDVSSLLVVLDSPAAYIGMIGSRRRVNGVFELLERERGIPREKLQRVYAPIGLEIGALTPAEIALSILAEVVNVYRHGRAPSASDYRRRPQAASE